MPNEGNAQGFVMQDSSSIAIGDGSSLYLGVNASFDGVLDNGGEIESGGDLDFKSNTTVGNLKLVGDGNQSLFGDTLSVSDIVVEKPDNANVILETDRVIVSGMLDVTSGVVQTDKVDDIVVSGTSDPEGGGYVEGNMIGLTAGQPVTFPMGVNGFTNYLTISNTDPGVVIITDCRVPNPATLLPDEEMLAIPDEVEWLVRTVQDSAETDATISIDFSGIDFDYENVSNGKSIRSNAYGPAIVMFDQTDSLYHVLEFPSPDSLSRDERSSITRGGISGSRTIRLSNRSTRIALAWVPIVDAARIYMPNAFAPGSTIAENRIFRPFFEGNGESITRISFAVFNGLNVEVYSHESSGTDLDLSLIGWDGRTSSGQVAPTGIYYYRVSVEAGGQVYPDEENRAGTVLLVD